MEIKAIYITDNNPKLCSWCHKPLPSDIPKQTKYCSDECKNLARKLSKRVWYRDHKEIVKERREEKKQKRNKILMQDKEDYMKIANSFLNQGDQIGKDKRKHSNRDIRDMQNPFEVAKEIENELNS